MKAIVSKSRCHWLDLCAYVRVWVCACVCMRNAIHFGLSLYHPICKGAVINPVVLTAHGNEDIDTWGPRYIWGKFQTYTWNIN
jgi:hypothetical protein